MSTSKIIYQVDAFTSEPFRGNPAGVCILDKEMPEAWMKNIAAEMNLSETAFIYGPKEEYKIRFFTPESEIPLCGHATLSSGHIMYENGIADRDEEIIFNSKAGRLKIRYHDTRVVMDFPAYDLFPSPVPEGFSDAVGANPLEFYKTEHGWAFVLLENEDEVKKLNPDFRAMRNSEFGDLIVTAPSGDPQFDFCVRCFAPAVGIDEDPVTGSAHCALAPFWSRKTGKPNFISHQVSKRGGILKVSLQGNRVEIAGQAITVLKAELLAE
jgi:PhzF family phenazine biosynthesis protein